MFVDVYICMYVCMHVCTYVCMHGFHKYFFQRDFAALHVIAVCHFMIYVIGGTFLQNVLYIIFRNLLFKCCFA